MQRLLIILLSLVIAGCSTIYGDKGAIRNRDREYLQAKSIPPLKIPPGLSSSKIEALYPVVADDNIGGNPNISLVPPNLNTASK